MTLGSLFAGIGGFDLGFERAGFKTVWQVEIDQYCRRILEKHFPRAERFADIRDCGAHNLKPVDVICGGFPCQDVSIANVRGKGIEGNRSGLWKQMLRVVRECRPIWVVVENVPNLRLKGACSVISGLEEEGYSVIDPIVVGAWCFGAAQLRQRAIILAYSRYSSARGGERCKCEIQAKRGCKEEQPSRRIEEAWRHWASEPGVGRVAYGIPRRMDRLKALGNSICPQLSQWIAERIIEGTEAR